MLGAALLALASRLIYCFHRGLGADVDHLFDDALITLRYVRNLAAGLGLVYNPGEPFGEPFLGTSSPLYALLMALPAALGLDPLWSAVLWNAGCDAAICALLIRLGRGCPLFQLLAPVAFLLHTNILYWSGTGMEFSLLVLLTLGAIALFAAGRPALSGGAAALAIVCRLDALIGLAGFAIVALLQERRVPWRSVAACAATAAPWFLFALAAYGDVVPLSARARYLIYPPEPFGGDALRLLLSSPWLPAALLGAWLAWRKTDPHPPAPLPPQTGIGGRTQNSKGFAPRAPWHWKSWWKPAGPSASLSFVLRALSLHPLLFLLAYEGTGGTLYRRYQVAIEATLIVLGCAGLAFLLDRLRERGRRWPAAAALALCAYLLASPLWAALRYPWQPQELPGGALPGNAVHLAAARWLAANSPPDAVVMAGNIGIIGYFSERRIFDSKGLASPAAYRALAEGRPAHELLALARPDYLALDPDEYAELRPHLGGYRLVLEERHPQLEWLVYRVLARNRLDEESATLDE